MTQNNRQRPNEGEPAEDACNTYKILDNGSSDNTSFLDPYSYISTIENHLLSQSDKVFRVRLKPENQNVMIRTLLGIPNKTRFSKYLQLAKNESEFRKMAQFTREVLSPRIGGLSNEVKAQKLPNVDKAIERALVQPTERGNAVFNRIATGKQYRGNMVDLLQDIAPELVPLFNEAMTPLTDAESYSLLVESVCQERVKIGDELDPVRVQAAKKCIRYFSHIDAASTDAKEKETHATAGNINGKECEEACVKWLHHRHRDTQNIILPNVNVSQKSTSKYVTTMKRTKSNESESSSANHSVLWTNIDRNKVSNEFDALVTEEISDFDNGVQLKEIWEAKFTLSPNTINDAIKKKMSAMRSMLQDDDLRLFYDGKEYLLNKKEENCSSMTFGIYGMEIMSPRNSLWQLIYTISQIVINEDVETVLYAIENEFIEVKAERIHNHLCDMREMLDTINDFNVLIKLSDKLSE